MTREWYVFKLNKREDTSKGRFAGNQQAQVAPLAARNAARIGAWAQANIELDEAPRPARRNALRNELPTDQPPVEIGENGYGFTIHREDMQDMKFAFTTEEAAIRWATDQAQRNPKVLYGIYSCVKVFETTTPTVIEKTFNDAGELLVRQ